MKKIIPLLKPKIITLILTVLLAIGIGTTYAIAKNQKQKEEPEAIWRSSFHNSFLEDNIFAEMEEVEKHMNKVFEEHRKLMTKMIQSADKNDKKNLRNKNYLALYQDDTVYRYELIFDSFKKEEIAIAVNDGVLTIVAKSEKSEKKKIESHSVNSLFYSIPVSSDVNGNPEIKREDGKITIIFKKLETAPKEKIEPKKS